MAPPNAKTTPVLLEAIKFAAGIGRETPYEDLTKAALDAGWVWYLHQSDVAPLGPLMLVNFDVMLGKTDGADLAVVDTISVMVTAGQGPLSSAARNLAQASLIHLFFGRLPPAPVQAPVPRAVERGYEEYDEPASAPRSTPHLVEDRVINVVERRTPDGLPIFGDLYAFGEPGPDVVDAVLDVMQAVLPDVTSMGALTALWTHNTDAMQYVQDLGTPDQRQDLKRMLDQRKAAIENGGDTAPRRRQSAPVVN